MAWRSERIELCWLITLEGHPRVHMLVVIAIGVPLLMVK